MSLIINFGLYQLGWFAIVVGAANGRPALGAGLGLAAVTVHLACPRLGPATQLGNCSGCTWLHARQFAALVGRVPISLRDDLPVACPTVGRGALDAIRYHPAVLPWLAIPPLPAVFRFGSDRWPHGLLCGRANRGRFVPGSAAPKLCVPGHRLRPWPFHCSFGWRTQSC